MFPDRWGSDLDHAEAHQPTKARITSLRPAELWCAACDRWFSNANQRRCQVCGGPVSATRPSSTRHT